MGKLLVESINEPIELITEGIGDDKAHYLSGIMMQAETLNKNGRIYPFDIMSREVDNYNRNFIRNGRALGELSHPSSVNINPDRVSHLVTELYPDGNNFIGKARLLDTPTGNIIKGIITGGGQVGVSTRGVGSLSNDPKGKIVGKDFKLICIDCVLDPSAPQAWVQGLYEDVEWIYENGEWTEQQYDKAKKIIKEASREDIETVSLALFTDYINRL